MLNQVHIVHIIYSSPWVSFDWVHDAGKWYSSNESLGILTKSLQIFHPSIRMHIKDLFIRAASKLTKFGNPLLNLSHHYQINLPSLKPLTLAAHESIDLARSLGLHPLITLALQTSQYCITSSSLGFYKRKPLSHLHSPLSSTPLCLALHIPPILSALGFALLSLTFNQLPFLCLHGRFSPLWIWIFLTWMQAPACSSCQRVVARK